MGLMVCACMWVHVRVPSIVCVSATPTAVMVGTGMGAEHGVIIKGGKALEAGAHINVVCFDKTGTLTQGQLSVAEVVVVQETEDVKTIADALFWAGSIELNSEHPLGTAVVRAAQDPLRSVRPLQAPTEFRAESGLGVTGVVSGRRVCVGNARWLSLQRETWMAHALQVRGQTASTETNTVTLNLGRRALSDMSASPMTLRQTATGQDTHMIEHGMCVVSSFPSNPNTRETPLIV
jgi:cation transport ATPase